MTMLLSMLLQMRLKGIAKMCSMQLGINVLQPWIGKFFWVEIKALGCGVLEVVYYMFVPTPQHRPGVCFSKLQISHVKLLETSNNQIPRYQPSAYPHSHHPHSFTIAFIIRTRQLCL